MRDYKVDGQLGLEPTFQEYVDKLVEIFDQVKRVLKKTGTCWVVLGDTYSGMKQGNTQEKRYKDVNTKSFTKQKQQIPDKSLCMIPERFAIKMIDHGWILRNKIVWYKGNAMPSSAKDRFTVDWEYVFFFVKSQKYFFETQYEPFSPLNLQRKGEKQYLSKKEKLTIDLGIRGGYLKMGQAEANPLGRMKRCVWKISTKPFSGAHFAVFPPDLIEPMLKAGCPKDGIVLDPFMGAGTTALAALKQNKQFIGIELNKQYIEIANERLKPYLAQQKLV